jgi:hypothetical protein
LIHKPISRQRLLDELHVSGSLQVPSHPHRPFKKLPWHQNLHLLRTK